MPRFTHAVRLACVALIITTGALSQDGLPCTVRFEVASIKLNNVE